MNPAQRTNSGFWGLREGWDMCLSLVWFMNASSPNLSLAPAQKCSSSGEQCVLLLKERHRDLHTACK